MHIIIVGRGPSAEPLMRLAERPGYAVRWLKDDTASSGEDTADLCILAGSRAEVETLLAGLPTTETVLIDATTRTVDDRAPDHSDSVLGGIDWIATRLPCTDRSGVHQRARRSTCASTQQPASR